MHNCWQITFEPIEELSEEIQIFLDEYFNVVACNYTDDGMEEYVGYISPDFDEKDFRKKSKTFNLPKYKAEALENKNWLTENVIKFPPLTVGDFSIYGIHEKNPPKTNKIQIQIYAATAFGSNHQTTKLCLKSISHLNKTKAGKERILDMGCGSGILSLACAKLWNKCQVTAVDIDDEATIVTNQNATDNHVSEKIHASTDIGYKNVKGSYDIILSNILARPLVEMSKDLHKHLKKGGFCVLSGFNDEQLDWVVKSHKEHGLELVKVYKSENWRAVIMEKKA